MIMGVMPALDFGRETTLTVEVYSIAYMALVMDGIIPRDKQVLKLAAETGSTVLIVYV